jgi:hypothetical protein
MATLYHVRKVSLIFVYNCNPEIFLFNEILIDFLYLCAKRLGGLQVEVPVLTKI